MKQKLLSIVGPTAVGKTALSIELAKRYQGEVISGDSMQVYRTLDIGTAKVMPDEMQGIKHHLIDILDPSERFHAPILFYDAKKAARKFQNEKSFRCLRAVPDFTFKLCWTDSNWGKTNIQRMKKKGPNGMTMLKIMDVKHCGTN